MCRWRNGDVSSLSTRSKEQAIIMLDQWDNAELAELRQIRDFMVDFRLTDKGRKASAAFSLRKSEINQDGGCFAP